MTIHGQAAVVNLGANMPKDTIERAIARGAGGGEGNDVEEAVYEAMPMRALPYL